MTGRRRLSLACAGLLLAIAGCNLEAPAPNVPINRETALALTPEASATPTLAPTAVPTATPTPQPSATARPSASAVASASALVDVSYCRRSFGSANGARFSARLAAIRPSQTDDFEQLSFVFSDVRGSLHGLARCVFAADWARGADLGTPEAPGDAVIELELADWAHDDLFAASPLTETTTLTDSGVLEQVAFAARSLDSRGAVLGVGLSEPRPFRVRVQGDELILEVPRDASYPPDDDPLGQAAGAAPDASGAVFVLQAGDVYRLENGRATAITRTPELETALAISPDGRTLAVCRAPADAEPFALPYGVRATLWTMRVDGSDQQQLADVGGCAEPAFASSGRTIAFTANVAPSPPAVLQIWTVPVVGGTAEPVTPIDEWSRSHPRWLDDGRLVYRASTEDGRGIVLVRETDDVEREVSAQILTGASYASIGDFVVDSENGRIAVEALRADEGGADLVVLDLDGRQVAVEQRGFWQRPLAFTSQGLVYLTAECPSDTVMQYSVHRRPSSGPVETLVSGSTAAQIGAAVAQDETLIYVRSTGEAPGLRGPATRPDLDAISSVWALGLDGDVRAQLYRADGGIAAIVTQ